MAGPFTSGMPAGPARSGPAGDGGAVSWRRVRMADTSNSRVDLLADEHAAGFEGGVPVDAPVLAVDGGLALEPDALVAVGVDGGAGVLEVDGHGLGDALDGEVAGDPVVLGVDLLDRGGGEGDLRVGLHVEEVVALEVAVAVGVAGVDAGGLDGQLQVRVGRVLGVEVAGAVELVERAADLGDHGVAGDEADPAVGRVDGVGAGQGGGGGGGAHGDALLEKWWTYHLT